VIEATEEAILNALCMARSMEGVNGNLCRALPLSEVRDVVSLWQRQLDAGKKAASQAAAHALELARQAAQARPPQREEAARRDSGAPVTAALAKPTAVRGAEGMPLPLRPSARTGGEGAASAGQVGLMQPGVAPAAPKEGVEPSKGEEKEE
jgi:D-aminopeptidase